MSLRWRKNGTLICGAKSEPEDNDCYIDDRLHYMLSVELGVVVPDKNEEDTGLWYWAGYKYAQELNMEAIRKIATP